MKLGEITLFLVTGEFREHSIGRDLVNNNVNPVNLGFIIPLLNLARKSLYTKKLILLKQIIVDLNSMMTDYKLHKDFAWFNEDSPIPQDRRYISDSLSEPFRETVVDIITVVDELGREKYLNDSNQLYSLHTIAKDIIQHPYPNSENSIGVMAQCVPEDVPMDATLDTEVVLDENALEVILYFIGSRVHVNLSKADTMSEANFYYQKYLEARNSFMNTFEINTGIDTDTSIRDQGFY